MNIDISTIEITTTTTVFALFYAIMFGGMLNRLSQWSAFGPESDDENRRRVGLRVLLSYLLLHGLPAIYFAVAAGLLSPAKPPLGILKLSLCALGLFFSVLFAPPCTGVWF